MEARLTSIHSTNIINSICSIRSIYSCHQANRDTARDRVISGKITVTCSIFLQVLLVLERKTTGHPVWSWRLLVANLQRVSSGWRYGSQHLLRERTYLDSWQNKHQVWNLSLKKASVSRNWVRKLAKEKFAYEIFLSLVREMKRLRLLLLLTYIQCTCTLAQPHSWRDAHHLKWIPPELPWQPLANCCAILFWDYQQESHLVLYTMPHGLLLPLQEPLHS